MADPEMARFVEALQAQSAMSQQSMLYTEMCWEKCVEKPGSKPIEPSGDSKTLNCLQNCVGRFFETSIFILTRFQEEQQQQAKH